MATRSVYLRYIFDVVDRGSREALAIERKVQRAADLRAKAEEKAAKDIAKAEKSVQREKQQTSKTTQSSSNTQRAAVEQLVREQRKQAKEAADTSKETAELRRRTEGLARAERDLGKQAKANERELGKQAKATERLGKQSKSTARDVQAAGGGFRGFSRNTDQAWKSADRFNASFKGVGNVTKLIKWPALISGAGLAAGALNNVAAGAVGLGASVGQAGGAVAAMPQLLSAAGQASGVASLAFKNFGAALKGNQKALESLTPEARQFLGTIKGLRPEIASLRRSAQSNMFPGLETGIKSAQRNLPVLRGIVAATAKEMGRLGARAGRFAGSKAVGQDVKLLGRDNVVILDRAGSGALNLANAMRNVVVAARPLTLWMTRIALRATESIDKWAQLGRATWSLDRFFAGTRKEMERLWRIGRPLAVVFGEIAKAAKPLGDAMLDSFGKGAEALERWSKSTRGRGDIAAYFRNAKGPLFEFGRLLGDTSKTLLGFGLDPALAKTNTQLIRQMRTELLPVFADLLKTSAKSFGPAFIDALTEVLKLFGTLAGPNGPLVLFVKGIGAGASVVNTLLTRVPGLKAAVVTLGGALAIIKATQFVGAISGISKMVGLVKKATVAYRGLAVAEASAGSGAPAGRGAASAPVGRGMVPGSPLRQTPVPVPVVPVSSGARAVAGLRNIGAGWGPQIAIASAVAFGPTFARKVGQDFKTGGGAGLFRNFLRFNPVTKPFKEIDDQLGKLNVKVRNTKVSLNPFSVSGWKQNLGTLGKSLFGVGSEADKTRKSVARLNTIFDQGGGGLVKTRRDATNLTREFGALAVRTRGIPLVPALMTKAGQDVRRLRDVNVAIAKLRNDGSSNVRGLQRAFDRNMTLIRQTVGENTAQGRDAASRNMRALSDAIETQVRRGRISAQEGMAAINAALKSELRRVAVTAKDVPIVGPAIVQAAKARGGIVRAQGGWVGGPGMVSEDVVHMMLPPGAAVFNRHQQPFLPGVGHSFAGGGQVPVSVGYGEYVAMPHEMPAIDAGMRARWNFGVDDLFSSVTKPHYLAEGGRVGKVKVRSDLGELSLIAQGAVDIARDAANRKLAREAAKAKAKAAQSVGGGGTYTGPLDKTFPRGSSATISPEATASLAQKAGLPGVTYAQIAKGESGFRPGAVSPDGGFGLWQMTPRVQSAQTVAAWEKIGSYFNPWNNAQQAKYLAGPGNGLSNYFGTGFVKGGPTNYTGGKVPGLAKGGKVAASKDDQRKWVRAGYTVYNDSPPGAFGGSLSGGYAELGTAKRTDGSGTGRGNLAKALLGRWSPELPVNFPIDIKIGGKTERLRKRDRGYGQGGDGIKSDPKFAVDVWRDMWGKLGLNANSSGSALVRAASGVGSPKGAVRTDDLVGDQGLAGTKKGRRELRTSSVKAADWIGYETGRAAVLTKASAAAAVDVTKSKLALAKAAKAAGSSAAGSSTGGPARTTRTRSPESDQLWSKRVLGGGANFWSALSTGSDRVQFSRMAGGQPARVPTQGNKAVWPINNMMAALAGMSGAGGVMINALTGGTHTAGSKHYSGEAVDLDNGSPLGLSRILGIAGRFGGRKNYESSHIHLDFARGGRVRRPAFARGGFAAGGKARRPVAPLAGRGPIRTGVRDVLALGKESDAAAIKAKLEPLQALLEKATFGTIDGLYSTITKYIRSLSKDGLTKAEALTVRRLRATLALIDGEIGARSKAAVDTAQQAIDSQEITAGRQAQDFAASPIARATFALSRQNPFGPANPIRGSDIAGLSPDLLSQVPGLAGRVTGREGLAGRQAKTPRGVKSLGLKLARYDRRTAELLGSRTTGRGLARAAKEVVDPESTFGLDWTASRLAGDQRMLQTNRSSVQGQLAKVTASKRSDPRVIAKLKEELTALDDAIAKTAVEQVETYRKYVARKAQDRIDTTQFTLDWTRGGSALLEASQRVARTQDTPRGMLDRAALTASQIPNLQRLAGDYVNQAQASLSIGDLTGWRQALLNAQQATTDLATAQADAADLMRDAAVKASQEITRGATFGADVADVRFAGLELDQRLSQTYDTDAGRRARADYITQTIIPALATERTALWGEVQTAGQQFGTGSQEYQQAWLAWAAEDNKIKSQQLAVQEQTAENTDSLKELGGTLAFQYGGQTTTDLIAAGMGA